MQGGLAWDGEIEILKQQKVCHVRTFIIEGVDLCVPGAELEKEGEAVQRVVPDCQVIASLTLARLFSRRGTAFQQLSQQAGLVIVYCYVERSLPIKL